MVDIEADGPIPGDYSMISIGVVLVEPGLDKTFYGKLRPISDRWDAESLKVSGHSREETQRFDDPHLVMTQLSDWISTVTSGKPRFIADNNGFDWQFVNWYFHHFLGANPFGHSSTNLGSLYKGMLRDMSGSFKHLRTTPHTHHPVDDAKGNAEALLKMCAQGLKLA